MSEQATEMVDTATPVETALNPFDESSWVEKSEVVSNDNETTEVIEDEIKKPSTIEDAKATDTSTGDSDVVDIDEYVKKELGYDNFGSLKDEVQKLKELKEQASTKEEIKFANEQSRKLFDYLKEGKDDDVFSYLDLKRKLSGVDNMPAIDALRMKIELENKHYSKEDVNDVIEEMYSYPEEPIQDLETDEEFAKIKEKWQSQVDKVKRRIERDGIVAKDFLAKQNQELVLPDIEAQKEVVQSNQPTPEELAKVEQIRNDFLKTLDANYSKFNGYEVKYKDEEVEIPVTFAVSDEDKLALKNKLSDFNVEEFILGRWFDAEGQPKVEQMMDDITILTSKENILQKMVNEVGTKMKEHYIKVKSNVSVNGQQKVPETSNVLSLDQQAAHIWANA